MYVLERPLQTGRNIFHKWKDRINWVNTSNNVFWVIDQVAGHFSPQFHVSFGQGFQTVNKDGVESLWAIKYGCMNQIGNFGEKNY